jgi:hypothetical protein
LRKRIPAGLLILAAVCLALPAAFITLHLLTPSDGARLSDGEPVLVPQGAVVLPYQQQEGSGLQAGDVVTAVEGRTMESLVRSLLRGELTRPGWTSGQTVVYTILREGRQLELPVTLGQLPLAAILNKHWGVLAFALVSQVVAAFVLYKKPGDPAARALFIWAMSGSHTYGWSFFLQVGDLVGGLGFWMFRLVTPFLWLIYWPAALHVALVFPRPLPLVRRHPRLVVGLYLASFALFAGLLAWQWPRSANALDWLNRWFSSEYQVSVLFLLATMIVILRQYRVRATPIEREKIRWTVYGVAISGGLGTLLWTVVPALTGRSVLSPNLLGLVVLPFPLTLALAIWRHQLFDIDLIINRTLVYTLLSGLLAGVYFASVVLLQLVFPAQTQASIVLSTLAIAALFSPLRNRVQAFIDRRFYRRKYDAEQALAAFSTTVRDEVDLGVVQASLTAIVQDTIQPQHVSLWLQGPELKQKTREE